MEKFKKVFSSVMATFSVIVFIFGFAVFLSVMRASAGSIPSVLGFSVLQVKTGSMEPFIKTGSIILVRKTDPKDLEVGDVITFYSSDSDIRGMLNTHRIVQKYQLSGGSYSFVTKGDANSMLDSADVYGMNVLGKYCYNLGTASGSVMSVLKNPKIIFFFIILPLIFITFSEAFNLVSMIVNNRIARREGTDDQNEAE